MIRPLSAAGHLLADLIEHLLELRPIGRVRFGRDEVDVITEGEYIDSNQEVEVMTVEGARVVVRKT